MSCDYSVRIQGKSKNVDVNVSGDQSILDATLRANEWLPHSCTQGTCGTCKLRVLSGDVDHGASPEYTLTADERAEGLALGCMACPRSDLTVEPIGGVVDDGTPRHPLEDFSGTIASLDDVAANTRRIRVRLDRPMDFNAGQYAELIVPGKGASRQYSMANSPNDNETLEFHVKLTPGGIATDGWIFSSLRLGDRIELRGPLGQFTLALPQKEPALLIGGGTGLAPLKSIALHALSNQLVPEIYLYHGGRRYEDLYDVEFFRDLDRENPTFHYRPALSEQSWDGATGMVTDVVLSDFTSCKGMSAYLCGPPAMVEAAVKTLKRRRMAPRLIFREEFTVSVPTLSPTSL